MSIGAGIAIGAIWASMAAVYIKRGDDKHADFGVLIFLGFIITLVIAGFS